jgi:hypothetical protein
LLKLFSVKPWLFFGQVDGIGPSSHNHREEQQKIVTLSQVFSIFDEVIAGPRRVFYSSVNRKKHGLGLVQSFQNVV